MIGVSTAGKLLDFDRVMHNPQRAWDQLEGSVALYNILERQGVAYLADEVGMGKTYVALGVVALLRHFRPDLRVLFIAPRENIQRKWQRERRVFTENNIRFDDLRVRMPGGVPARPAAHCAGLLQLLRETALDPDRDFFVRMPSFSLPLREDAEQRRGFRDKLRRQIPWLPDNLVDLRAPADTVKDRFAQAINTVLPHFDLVIIDEAHNLKHGWTGRNVSSRNRVLATVLGRPRTDVEPGLRAKYGSRAGKLLLISATPVDDDYQQLWNQLDLFDRGGPFIGLKDREASEERRRAAVGEFLIRRVTSLEVGGQVLTKNLYRREWRQGGVDIHDEPIQITGDRQRLAVALVQKKVSEVLGHERFGTRFQIGMLASFESFLQTSQVRLDPDDADAEAVNFDGADQAGAEKEARRGVDVPMLNDLAGDHARVFGSELPHPKMDTVVARLSTSWLEGRKGLVFVRRVASVGELQQKLNDEYNTWLIDRLEHRLRDDHQQVLAEAVGRFRGEQRRGATPSGRKSSDEDHGDADTFFAWFFRGNGPAGIVSGATIQERFRNRGGPLGTFFDDNYVMAMLDAPPGQVRAALAGALSMTDETLTSSLRDLSGKYLTAAKQHTRGARFDAAQAAALELLARTDGPYSAMAAVIWDGLYRMHIGLEASGEADPELLETRTFFTELRHRKALRDALWPAPAAGPQQAAAFRERYVRSQMLSAAARLGHSFIDLYCIVTDHLSSLQATTAIDPEAGIIEAFLDELQRQMDDVGWSCFAELAALSDNHQLILDTNLSTARDQPLSEIPALLGRLFGAQRPVGGMTGKVNQTLVQQFRLPGYPLVLICTDLLQEGEDLHTFCSAVYHYGLAWTPSAIEQRIGRIDRVRSETERRLTAMNTAPDGDDLLQVYYPHLIDTVERLQARRVLHRLNDFTRLMHEGLSRGAAGDSHLDIRQEALVGDAIPDPPGGELKTSFPIRPELLAAPDRPLAVDESQAHGNLDRFDALTQARLAGLRIVWDPVQPRAGLLRGAVVLAADRQQPFTLRLRWDSDCLVVRCSSPVGLVNRPGRWDELAESTASAPIRLVSVAVSGDATYDITVEENVLLTTPRHDAARIGAVIRRVTDRAGALQVAHPPAGVSANRSATAAADDWHRLCGTDDFTLTGSRIRVRFANGRSHRIRVRASDDGYLITASIAGWDVMSNFDDPYEETWKRNRHSSLVGYLIDTDGTLMAHGWTPKAGLTSKAFQALIRVVAREADRFELHLTGQDRR